jgi:hypothetical protein
MIRFWCECGRQLQAREEYVGEMVACPACERRAVVPEADQPKPAERGRADDVQTSPDRPPRCERDEDGYADRPRRRRRRVGEGDGPPASNGKATTALILGICSLCLGPLLAIPAIIFGALALRDSGKGDGGSGKGLAITGLVLGCLGMIMPALILPALLLPAVYKVRQAAGRQQENNYLKQHALAMHNYHSAMGTFPPAAAYLTKDGQPGLSWRVALLPYLEQDNLFRQFKLDEPWDSPNNRALLSQMPKVFAAPGDDPTTGLTRYQVLVGPGTIFEDLFPNKPGAPRPPGPPGALRRGVRITDITDGTSNTILIVTARDPVEWTRPIDLPYDPAGPLPALDMRFSTGPQVAMADGSTRSLSPGISDATLRNAITRNDGMVLGSDW